MHPSLIFILICLRKEIKVRINKLHTIKNSIAYRANQQYRHYCVYWNNILFRVSGIIKTTQNCFKINVTCLGHAHISVMYHLVVRWTIYS